jgi:hypothetical protein
MRWVPCRVSIAPADAMNNLGGTIISVHTPGMG